MSAERVFGWQPAAVDEWMSRWFDAILIPISFASPLQSRHVVVIRIEICIDISSASEMASENRLNHRERSACMDIQID